MLRLALADADPCCRACALDTIGSMLTEDEDVTECASLLRAACRDGSAFVRREAALLIPLAKKVTLRLRNNN